MNQEQITYINKIGDEMSPKINLGKLYFCAHEIKLENMNEMTHLTIGAGHKRVNRTKKSARVNPMKRHGKIHL